MDYKPRNTENSEIIAWQMRTSPPRAALSILAEAQERNFLPPEDALMMVTQAMLESVLNSSVQTENYDDVFLRTAPGTPGAGSGITVKREDLEHYAGPEEFKAKYGSYILVLDETTQSDSHWIDASSGVVTFNGGPGSHATIYTRSVGVPALVGTGALDIKSGEEVTLDGSQGLLFKGSKEITPPDPGNVHLQKLMNAAMAIDSGVAPKMKVKANEQAPLRAAMARSLGAEGIGVARTEFMFNEPQRLPHMQAMAVFASQNNKERMQQELDALFPMQKQDFKGLLMAMDGLPVTIRLLDEPFNEFRPKTIAEMQNLAQRMNMTLEDAQAAFRLEANPMLGERAVRLAMMHPEIYATQVRAVLEAAIELQNEGRNPQPQIMIPLVSFVHEAAFMKRLVEDVAAKVENDTGVKPAYQYGIMMETPVACARSAALAESATFYSFGTNDLTQTSIGYSRDDVARVTALYLEQGGIPSDPFVTIDDGVLDIMKMGITRGKAVRPDMQVSTVRTERPSTTSSVSAWMLFRWQHPCCPRLLCITRRRTLSIHRNFPRIRQKRWPNAATR